MKFLSIFAVFKFLLERFNLILRFSLQVAFIFLETIWLISNTWRFIRLWDLLSCIVTMIGSNFVKHFNKTERENLSSSSSIHCTAKKMFNEVFLQFFAFYFSIKQNCRSCLIVEATYWHPMYKGSLNQLTAILPIKKGKSFHSLNSINLLIQALSKVLKDCKLFATLILIKTQFYSNRGENRKLIIISKFQLLIPVLSEHFRFLFVLG